MRIARRWLVGAAAGLAVAPWIGRHAAAQASGPADPGQIDIARAKAEGKVMLYTSLDTQIVDAINIAFKARYGIEVQYFRGGSADVTSKVLAEADAGRPQADMVDASDLAALLLMKDRVLQQGGHQVCGEGRTGVADNGKFGMNNGRGDWHCHYRPHVRRESTATLLGQHR